MDQSFLHADNEDSDLTFARVKTGLRSPPSGFPTDRSKVVPLLRFVFVCASVVS